MKKVVMLIVFFLVLFLVFLWPKQEEIGIQTPKFEKRSWSIKSVDTMKYSRDLAGERLNDPTFDQTIDLHVKSIAELGATHVAIGTPYDDAFIPFLKRWVASARKYNLKVWFRGNFSGWEGWFGHTKELTRDEHLELTRQFINNNGNLFENGDIFSPCPECEHGAPGDPRQTGDVTGFRQFLIAEHQLASSEFREIGKNVRIVGSMNYDIASLVMDEQTANSVGNLIVIDHYVKTPQDMANDIKNLAQKANAQIIIGEFGTPIPDIHGRLDQNQQAAWIEEALSLISLQEEVIGLNYWTSFGGSTEIFNIDGSPKPAAKVLEKHFKLQSLPTLF